MLSVKTSHLSRESECTRVLSLSRARARERASYAGSSSLSREREIYWGREGCRARGAVGTLPTMRVPREKQTSTASDLCRVQCRV